MSNSNRKKKILKLEHFCKVGEAVRQLFCNWGLSSLILANAPGKWYILMHKTSHLACNFIFYSRPLKLSKVLVKNLQRVPGSEELG